MWKWNKTLKFDMNIEIVSKKKENWTIYECYKYLPSPLFVITWFELTVCVCDKQTWIM